MGTLENNALEWSSKRCAGKRSLQSVANTVFAAGTRPTLSTTSTVDSSQSSSVDHIKCPQAREDEVEAGEEDEEDEETKKVDETFHEPQYSRAMYLGGMFLRCMLGVDAFVRFPTSDEGRLSKEREQHLIKIKQIHDFSCEQVKYVVGSAFTIHGPESALRVAVTHLPHLRKILNWADFVTMYHSRSRSQVLSLSCSTFPPERSVLAKVETSIGYCFQNKSILIEALRHASCRRRQGMSYDRLEFLGDSALDVLIANYYMGKYPVSGSSCLHMLRQAAVNNKILGAICIRMGLHRHLVYNCRDTHESIKQAVKATNEAIRCNARGVSGGVTDAIPGDHHHSGPPLSSYSRRYWESLSLPKVLGDVVESVLGAVFVDSDFNFESIERVFEQCFLPTIERYLATEMFRGNDIEYLLMRVQDEGCEQVKLRVKDSILQLEGCAAQSDHGLSFTSSPSWTTNEVGHIPARGLQLKVCKITIHEAEIASSHNSDEKTAIKEAVKSALEALESDKEFLANLCSCHGTPKSQA